MQGAHLHRLSFGIDERNVEPTREAKSISNEETFASDLFDLPRVHSEIFRLSDSVGKRLRGSENLARTLSLKVRLSDFSTLVRSVTLPNPTDSGKVIARETIALLDTIDLSIGVRLLGVGASKFSQAKMDCNCLLMKLEPMIVSGEKLKMRSTASDLSMVPTQ